MKKDSFFSEIGLAYCTNLHNLNHARSVFEGECKALNQKIQKYCEKLTQERNKDTNLAKKFWWSKPLVESTKKDGAWTSFYQRTVIPICILQPLKNHFNNDVAFLYFEFCFDWEKKRHVFEIHFENKFERHQTLDENLLALALKYPEKYVGAKQRDGSKCLLSSYEIGQGIVDNFESLVQDGLNLVEELISIEYPDSLYKSSVSAEPPVEAKPDAKVA